MCSVENKKNKNESDQNDFGKSHSIEYWKSKYPRFFDKKCFVKLNRLKVSSNEKPKRNLKTIRESTCVRVTRSRKKEEISIDWARISIGIYKGDIAKVERLNINCNEAHLKLFPRVNYDSLVLNGELKERPSKRRPLLKAFDPNAIR